MLEPTVEAMYHENPVLNIV